MEEVIGGWIHEGVPKRKASRRDSRASGEIDVFRIDAARCRLNRLFVKSVNSTIQRLEKIDEIVRDRHRSKVLWR